MMVESITCDKLETMFGGLDLTSLIAEKGLPMFSMVIELTPIIKYLWGSWQDVPLGTTSGDGFLTLYIAQSGTKIFRYGAEASDSGSPFGGSEWTKNDNRDPLCMGVLGGSSTGSAGGFIQMFPTSPSK